jgi:hypothetical protein
LYVYDRKSIGSIEFLDPKPKNFRTENKKTVSDGVY